MFYNFIFFAKPSMDFIQLWRDDTALSKILCSTIPIAVHDLKIKVTDFEFFCIKSLQCQLLQSFWMIWIVFGMNGYKILKCFRKEKCVSGELPCPATDLIINELPFQNNFTITKWYRSLEWPLVNSEWLKHFLQMSLQQALRIVWSPEQ